MPDAGPLDILGQTFDDLCRQLRPRPAQLPDLRRAYAATLRGGGSVRVMGRELRAEPHPIVRTLREGELIKFIQQLPDGRQIESVVIPMVRRGRAWKTLCVSSQVGCAMGCSFCQTGQMGLLGNLSAEEIVGQVVATRSLLGQGVQNVVFMGMGEPLDNFDPLVQAIRVLSDPDGLAISRQRITISTVGRVAGIRRLRALGWRRINLAVSLNAPNDRIRSQIMPINRAEPMERLREALLEWPQRNCAHVMIEYVLIPGVNDAPEHARELAEFLRPVRCCVNVIPYNPRCDSPWPAPDEPTVLRFLSELRRAGQYCKRRLTQGRSVLGACGQLGDPAARRRPAATTLGLRPVPAGNADPRPVASAPR